MSETDLSVPFRRRAGEALRDAHLQEALTIATTKFIGLQREAFGEFPEGDRLRDLAREIKEATLQRLDRYLGELVDNVERLGGRVHYATTAEEARRVVLDIATRTGARMAVKSKSMATEEIHLNEALEAAGVTAVETDLGEYIIQLAHERPSHIIAPAIHKTKGQVADLFAKELGRRVAADPEVLTQIARGELREKFLRADLGITGANFAIADTGTVVLVTNEGNGRMVTSLPRVHVAVMGVEKVVPSMTDLMVFLQILAKSATGQKMSVYTTLVRGPRRAGELEGPEEFHLVLLDNGRIRQLAGTLREALYCLRCGACLNVCPVYRQIGGHAYGYTYPGPIGILLTAMLEGPASVKDLAHASSLCGACVDACPVRIDIPKMLVELRHEVAAKRLAPWTERVAYGLLARLLASPRLYRWAKPVARLLQRPFVRDGAIRRVPLFDEWTRTRDLPAVAARTFQERWRELVKEERSQ
ncbi:MAG TPA: LutB/LldF family L-lactate oxidation iron-sulfur protein [Methylomirabilota bacterium]|jgi:L-lactate dehydrogenase complex protein LldF|nr:LutB/LldF family L-lactate oxidation iron-sulfur protein [Methylomirabilota bacterium]